MSFLPPANPSFTPTPEQSTIKQTSGPKLISALAGSGKTATIKLCASPLDLGFSFSKKASEGLGSIGSTWHAKAYHLLKSKHNSRLRFDGYKDSAPWWEIAKREGFEAKDSIRDISALTQLCKNNLCLNPTEEEYNALCSMHTIDGPSYHLFKESFDASLPDINQQKISFADGLLLAYQKEVFRSLSAPHFWIDEAQDTNALQLALASHLPGPTSYVGDPNQAIYGFMGAGIDSWDRICFHNPNHTLLPLSTCFRCSSSVITEAQRLVPSIQPAPDAILGSVSTLTHLPDIPSPFQTAILSRTNKPLLDLLIQYTHFGIPVIFKDVSFLGKLRKEYDRKQRGLTLDKRLSKVKLSELKKEITILWSCLSVPNIEKIIKWRNPKEGLTLSTIHAAKGLEWNDVYLLPTPDQWEERIALAPAWQQQQDQNLQYVAITRARRNLTYVENI